MPNQPLLTPTYDFMRKRNTCALECTLLYGQDTPKYSTFGDMLDVYVKQYTQSFNQTGALQQFYQTSRQNAAQQFQGQSMMIPPSAANSQQYQNSFDKIDWKK